MAQTVIAAWIVTTFVIPGAGIALGIYSGNQGWLVLCFAPVLWAVDWRKFRRT